MTFIPPLEVNKGDSRGYFERRPIKTSLGTFLAQIRPELLVQLVF